MIRPHTETTPQGLIGHIKRRHLFRLGFLAGTLLAVTEISALVVPFIKPNKVLGLGAKVPVGAKAAVLDGFKATNDTPVLNLQGKFFLIHAPGGIIAAYRKCTHLGCSVPWNAAEDQFHCPCHGSIYLRSGQNVAGPAPRPLDLMEITISGGKITVDTRKITSRDRYDPTRDPVKV